MDLISYSLSKKIAASAVSGVQSMSVSGQTLTINTKDSGVLIMTFPKPRDGVSVTDIDVNANNQIVFTMSDGTEFISGKIPTVKGDKGDPFKYSDFTQEQLESLKGADGYTPQKGVDYFDGEKGSDGKSAYDIAVDNGFIGTEQEWLDSLGTKITIDDTVTETSDNAVSSKAVKAYVDASMKTEVKTEVSEQIKTEIGDTVQTTIEEKMAENMGTASNDDIDSLFA